MTRRRRARHDSGNEAGLHSPWTLYFALSLPCIPFASLASVVYAGGYLMAISATKLAGQCSNDLDILPALNISFAICLQTKCTSRHRPGSRLTWSDTRYRNAPFFLLDTPPLFLQSFHNAQHRLISLSFSEWTTTTGGIFMVFRGISDTGRN